MKRFVFSCLLLLIVSAPLYAVFAQVQVPVPVLQLATPVMVVNTPALNARSGPGPQYTVLITLPGGAELPVLASNADTSWYLVATPIGNAWIDVDFVLARGDFSFVPVIDVQAPSPAMTLPTPVTVQMVGAAQPFAARGATSAPASNRRASLNVISVDLRPGPFEASGVITTLYKDPNVDFVVLGEAFDNRGVEWVAIFVPGIGNGWIEKPKTTISVRTLTPTEARQQSATNVTTPGSLPVPVIELAPVLAIVNTPFLNIRSGPGPQFAPLAVASGGTTLTVVGLAPDVVWVLVEGTFGRGWVASEFVLLRGNLDNVPTILNAY
jgi:uncharacterized protein YraI